MRDRGAIIRVVFLCLAVFFLAAVTRGEIGVEAKYHGLGRSVEVSIRLPDSLDGEPAVVLVPAGEPIESGRSTPVEAGRADLASLFPSIWTTEAPRVLYAQLTVGGVAVGPPLVLEPMLSPVLARDGFTDALLEAAGSRDDNALLELARQPAAARAARERSVERLDDSDRAFSGYVVYPKADLVFETTLGDMRIATRPDAAPIAARTFCELAAGGFYDGITFHRIITDDGRGRPFVVQAGDPTGGGWGGAGVYHDFEPSDLPHDYGILSVARRPFDPNTNGSQFFICLSREACAPLDGLYTSFAQVVDGASVLRAMQRLETVVDGAGDGAIRTDRPVEPPTIRRARMVPSPPIDGFAPRITPPSLGDDPVER